MLDIYINVNNSGYLSPAQNLNLTLKYVKGMLKIHNYLADGGGTDYVIFDTNWNVDLKTKSDD